MFLLVLPLRYLWWHFTSAFRDIFFIYRSFLGFVYNFFSLPILATTLFSPWRRLAEEYPRGFNISGWLSTLIVNTLMRLVGFCVRLIMLAVGLFAWLMVLVLGLGFFVVWFFLPFALLLLLIISFYFIVR